MPTDLILNTNNYNQPTLTNGKRYDTGNDFGCNYPVDATTSFTITATLGSLYITTSTGDFLDLLGGDIQNNNVPVRKWIAGRLGEVLEIDYIESSTRAVLKEVSSYAIAGTAFFTVDYWGSPEVEETLLENVDVFEVVGVLVNTKIGPLTMNIGVSQSIELGADPITVDLKTTGAQCQLNIKYSN